MALSDELITRLAMNLSADKMYSVASGWLGFKFDELDNVKRDFRNSDEFNREVLRMWRNQKHDEDPKEVGDYGKKH